MLVKIAHFLYAMLFVLVAGVMWGTWLSTGARRYNGGRYSTSMRLSARVVTLVLALGVATTPWGQADPPGEPPWGVASVGWAAAGPPAFPAAVATYDEPVPALPATGLVGRGALIVSPWTGAHAGRDILILTDGRRYAVPSVRSAWGSHGSSFASLSPDGQWLGYRASEMGPHSRYQLCFLPGDRVIRTSGYPLMWSANGRFLVMIHLGSEGDLVLLDVATGVHTSMGSGLYRDGLWLTAAGPDGRPVYTDTNPALHRVLRLRADHGSTLVTFAAGEQDVCWCPSPVLHFGPDGQTFAVQLRYHRGLIPGTDRKSPRRRSNSAAIAIVDVATGHIMRRVSLPVSQADEEWGLHGYSEAGLLLMHRKGADTTLVMVDSATGAHTTLTRLPARTSYVLPGAHATPSDG
jgi:hypothetical protein